MRRALPYVLAGLLGFLLFALAQLPAGMLLERIDPGQRWLSAPVSGSVWSGQATLQSAGQPVGRLDWRLAATALLRGRLRLDTTLSGPDTSGALKLQRSLWGGDWSASDGRVQLPAARLTELLQLPVTLHGQLQGRVDRLDIGADGAPHLSASLQWQQPRIEFGRSWDLGVVTLRSEPTPDGSRIAISGRDGAIQPEGELLLTAGGYRLDLTLLPRTPPARTALQDYGAKGPDGRLRLVQQGNW
jgi:hypothetical protein